MCLDPEVITSNFEFIEYPSHKRNNRLLYNLPKLYERGKPTYGIGLKSFDRDFKGVLRSQFFSEIRVPEDHWLDAQACNPRVNVIPFTACTRQDPIVKAYRAGWHIYTNIFAISRGRMIYPLDLTPVVFCTPYLQEQKNKFDRQLVAVYMFVPEQGWKQDKQIKKFLNREILKYEKQHPLDNGHRYELFNV